MAAHDDTSPPQLSDGQESVEPQETAADRGNEQDIATSRRFTRLVTTSAVAAALAEVQGQTGEAAPPTDRPKKRRLDQRHSGGMEPPSQDEPEPGETQQPSQDHRYSAPTVEYPPVVIKKAPPKPDEESKSSPRGQLTRSTSTHLAGIRERLTVINKRSPSASSTPALKRTKSTSGGPSFRAAAKAVVVSAALTAGSHTNGTNGERSERGQNYEQMMARFQLRRLERTDSGKSLDSDTKANARHHSGDFMAPLDSELSQQRLLDDLMNSRSRSEGRRMDGAADIQSLSRADSRQDETPRRPGAPSFQSTQPTSVAAPSAAASAPLPSIALLGAVSGALGGSVRSNLSNPPQQPSSSHEHVRGAPQVPRGQHGQVSHYSMTRRESRGIERAAPVADQLAKFQSREGNRPRPLPRLKRRARVLLAQLRTPLSPFSKTARVRSFFLLVAFCAHTLGYPYEQAFHLGGRAWFMYVDSITEVIFFADLVLAFNTSFVNKRGVLVVSRRHIALNFLTGAFVFQFLAALPSTMLALVVNGDAEALVTASAISPYQRFGSMLWDFAIRLHRIIHILRVLREAGQVRDARAEKSVWGWLLYSRYSHLLRIVWIVGAVMLIAHGVACCWRLLLLDSATEDPNSVAAHSCGAPINPTVELEVYAECFYVAMQNLQGQSLTTYSTKQDVFASCVNLLGSIVLAVIFGHVAILVANFNANSTAYQRKMESVFAGMSKMQLPPPLRERIHQYYAHLWREYEALDGAPLERFAKELSHNLTLEVVLFKYMELAMHVPFWENCSPDFQKTLVLSLDTRVYLPDDFIVRRGEVGDEFYMINRGMCELVGNVDTQEHATEPLARRRSQMSDLPGDNATLYTTTSHTDHDDLGQSKHGGHRHARSSSKNAYVVPGQPGGNGTVKMLTRGQAFGEMALLMNYQRTANVRAMTYVEMCVLSRTAFQSVLTRYPADRKYVISQILISSLENNERFGIPCPLTAMVRSVFSGEKDGAGDGDKFITPRRAAKLIAWAVNPDVEDDSIKFALTAKLKDRLVAVRDQEFGVPSESDALTPRPTATTSSPRSEAPTLQQRSNCSGDSHTECCERHHHVSCARTPPKQDPDSDEQVAKLESVQTQTMALLLELQKGHQEALYPTASLPDSTPGASPQNGRADTVVNELPKQYSAPRVVNANGTPAISVQQRRAKFVRSRSISAPHIADSDVAPGIAPADSGQHVNNTAQPPSAKASQPLVPKMQRAVTARWLKTSEGAKPLRSTQNVSSSAVIRSRNKSGSSSHRFIQRVTSQLASLANSTATAQPSPTRYADQLFGTTMPERPLETAPSLNEMSYREGRVTSSNMSEHAKY